VRAARSSSSSSSCLARRADAGGGAGGGGGGFGVRDGVWAHAGWREAGSLQARVRAMPELGATLRALGRRPAAAGQFMARMPPQREDPRGAPGVAADPSTPAEMAGLARSGSLARMLPGEAGALRAGGARRRLFLARLAERALLSYELRGWEDLPARCAPPLLLLLLLLLVLLLLLLLLRQGGRARGLLSGEGGGAAGSRGGRGCFRACRSVRGGR